ncbi:FHA domain-containing protein [Wenzhouxiangella sp. XN79A]|uniref:FHA domain-containing protein n=1 Tax=Wenzhouxiangella sp. XN79A TaxID=2724193 RepID=UPI00144AB332|nr:FHA domain-containing protein [Wenzhouxiangella sp. XN79A]NKI34656.1 FHA domain-containing protein [Wenzhouxiangella sp. XN79A]
MDVVIEQLGTTNNVLERQKFDAHQVWIGRGYDNDVILTDEHVDARHARLVFDDEGRLWIEDRGSVNGIRRPRHRSHLKREQVRSGDVFLIGRSRVRILLGDHPVPAAVKIRFSEVLLLWLGKPLVLVALVLAYLGAKVGGTALTTIGEFRWASVVKDNLWEVIGFVTLAVVVYFLSVLFRRGGNFVAHLSLLVVLFFVAGSLDFLIDLAVFNASDDSYPWWMALSEARGYLVLFLYLWSILYLAFHLSLWRRSAIALVAVAVSLALEHLPDDPTFAFLDNETIPLQPIFLPPVLQLAEPKAAEAADAAQREVFEAADAARQRLLDEREADEAAQEKAREANGGDADVEPPGDDSTRPPPIDPGPSEPEEPSEPDEPPGDEGSGDDGAGPPGLE